MPRSARRLPRTKQGRKALIDALHDHGRRLEGRATNVVQLGDVVAVDPWQIELHASRRELMDDEIMLSQWVRSYHLDPTTGVKPGDTVVIHEKQTVGEEIHWVVTEVLSDQDPPKLTRADLEQRLNVLEPQVPANIQTTFDTIQSTLNDLQAQISVLDARVTALGG